MDFRLKVGRFSVEWSTGSPGRTAEEVAAAIPYPSGGVDMPDYPLSVLTQLFAPNLRQKLAPEIVRTLHLVRRCALLIANDIARVPMIFERETRGGKWEAIPRKPGNIVDLWHRANPVQTNFELMRDLVANFAATGNAYLVGESFRTTSEPDELWVMPSSNVEVVMGRRRVPAFFVFDRDGDRNKVDAGRVIHLRAWNPMDEPLGASDLEGVDSQLSARRDLNTLVLAYLRSGGVGAGFYRATPPSGVVSAPLGEDKAKEIEERLNRRRRGPEAFYKATVLPGLQWEKQTPTPVELGVPEIARMLDGDIAEAMGVPPVMVGIKSGGGKSDLGATVAASGDDVDRYWDNTNLPTMALVEGKINERLCARWPGVRCRYDLSRVPSLTRRVISLGTQLTQMAGGAIVTVNDARSYLGAEPTDDPAHDEIREPSSPMPFGGAPGDTPNDGPPKGEAPKPSEKPAGDPAAKSRRAAVRSETPDHRRRRHKVRREQYARRFARWWVAICDRQERRVLDAAEAEFGNARAYGRRFDVAQLLKVDLEDKDAVAEIYHEMVIARGEEALSQVATELDINLNTARAVAFIEANASALVTNTSQTTRDKLTAALADKLIEKATFVEVATVVREVFDGRRDTALTIARTEVGRAYNFAGWNAWEQVPEVVGFTWSTAGDGAVRAAHAAMEGSTALRGEPFVMVNPDTQEQAVLDYPGDGNAPGWASINCRCVLDPETDESVVSEKAMAAWWYTGIEERTPACAH